MAQSILLATLGTAFGLIAPCVEHKTSPRAERVVQMAFIALAVLCWRLA